MRLAALLLLCACSTAEPRRSVLFVERADGIWEVHVPYRGGTIATTAKDETEARQVAAHWLKEADHATETGLQDH